MTTCAAGIDAGKTYLDIGIEPSHRHFRVANADAGIEETIERLRHAGVQKVVLEAIGPYASAVVNRLVWMQEAYALTSNPGTPASSRLGMSGTLFERALVVTARPRSLPVLMCGVPDEIAVNSSWT